MPRTSMFNQGFEDVKSRLARSIKDVLTRESTLPPEERAMPFELHVPYQQLQADDDDPGYARARVTYVVNCPTEKKHTVYIKFKYDKAGRFLRNTMTYV